MSIFTADKLTDQFITNISENLGLSIGMVSFILGIIVIWSLTWKLLALWKSARKGSIIWFIVLALFNTIGILPMLYIFIFSKIDWNKLSKKKGKKTKKKK